MTGIACKTTYPITGLGGKTIKHHTQIEICVGTLTKLVSTESARPGILWYTLEYYIATNKQS